MSEAPEVPSAQALTAMAVVLALLEALLKRGVIDQAEVGIIVKDAGNYAQVLCTDCSQEVEREVQRLLDVVGTEATHMDAAEPAPIPIVDPT